MHEHATSPLSADDAGQHGPDDLVDVVVVGGGAAGLSAALNLARVRRSVVVVDGGRPRNAAAAHLHGYLSRDGMSPLELLAVGREEVRSYGAEVLDGVDARSVSREGDDGHFTVELDDGRRRHARRLLVGTGLADELPAIPGLAEQWGVDVVHCPFCHGWELHGDHVGVLGGPAGFGPHKAQLFRQATDRVTLFLHDGPAPTAIEAAQLAARGIDVVGGSVTELVAREGRTVGLRVAADGAGEERLVALDAVAVTPPMTARSELLERLGATVETDPTGLASHVPVDGLGATSVPGVWATGNVAEPMATVVMAAAGGARVAGAIHADLLAEDVRVAVESSGAHEPAPTMDEAWWDERYRQRSTIWSGEPNPVLVAEVGGLEPGLALEVGAGEGADALWLAGRGWTVRGVDISEVALERARRVAADTDEAVAERVEWVHADLLEWSPPAQEFDLVNVHYLHFPPEQRRDVYSRLARSVVPGGVLLVVAHHPSDVQTTAGRPRHLDMFFTAEELHGDLAGEWEVLVRDARPRTTKDPAGDEITVRDTVLMLRKG